MAGKRGNPNFGKKVSLEQNTSEEVIENVVEDTIEETITDTTEETVQGTPTKKVWKPDLTRMIAIKNISKGRLIYKSKRQLGYTVIWDNRNDINYMELSEFINLKNSDLRFVSEPWIRIIEEDEIEILKYANVYKYYQELIEVKDIEDIFSLDIERFKTKFVKFPVGYKNTLAEHAAKMIADGRLDSIKIKNFIEEQMELDLSILIPSSKSNKNNIIEIK